jgi:nuclear pore complex protein Nup155
MVDEERNYLYSYTFTNCSLSVYNLGPPGANQINLLGSIPSLAKAIQTIVPHALHKYTAKQSFGVVSLNVVPKSESRYICLVAVTFQGLRIYLVDGPSGGYNNNQGFRVAHVRFPPPDVEAGNLGDVARASYLNGAFLCAYGADVEQDHNPVVGASIDLGKLTKAQAGGPSGNQQNSQVSVHGQQMGNMYNPYPPPRPPLSEFHNTLSVSGRTWALKRMIKASSIVRYGDASQLIYSNASTYPTALNALATQFTEPPDQFLVLTNVSLTFVIRRRTSDVLRLVLEMEASGAMGGPPISEGLAAFVDA